MRGIDRLRALAGAWDAYGLGGALMDVADEIERERACDADTIENVRLIVGGVVDEMERHVSGVEGADDSPVARWARELREALGGNGRDPAEDVSMSAYDLLPEDERDAITWVRDHGGLESVKELLNWVVGHCSTKQQLDFDFWLSGRVMYELGFDEDMADRDEVERRLLSRLMPDGRFAPKVLDADGAEIRVGDTVWHVHDLDKFTVTNSNNGENLSVSCTGEDGKEYCCYPNGLTHRAPILASDGRPLREGETVYKLDDDRPYTLKRFDGDHVYINAGGSSFDIWTFPNKLTHERPESKCRDCAHWQKDPTADNMGVCWFFYHEHEGQDCYAARRADIGACEEFMPRTSALAERERGE